MVFLGLWNSFFAGGCGMVFGGYGMVLRFSYFR